MPTTDRLALFSPSLVGGGAERVTLNLCRAFFERGIHVDLVLSKAEGSYLDQVPSGVRVVDLGARRVMSGVPALAHYLRTERPSAMLSTQVHANVAALWARRVAGCRTRIVVREANTLSFSSSNRYGLRGRLVPLFARHAYRWADAVVAVSQGVAQDLVRLTGMPSSRVEVIYSPVVRPEILEKAQQQADHPWFDAGQPPVVLGVGRLTRQKDFSTLLRAFSLARQQCAARLIILGEGEQREELEALARELGIGADLSLPGFVANPYAYMARAGVFVLSSLWEGLPNSLIEAMATGTPVIATDCPSGPREILNGGQYGYLCTMQDVEGLARSMIQVIKHRVFALPTREWLDTFSMETSVDRYLSIMSRRSIHQA